MKNYKKRTHDGQVETFVIIKDNYKVKHKKTNNNLK